MAGGSESKRPSDMPLFDPPGRRAETLMILPSEEEPPVDDDWPFQFTWPGFVNQIQTSTSIFVATARTVTGWAVTLRSSGSTNVSANLLVNDVAVRTLGTFSGSSGSVSPLSSPLALAVGQRVAVRITSFGVGTAEGLWIGIR